jgi:hypothetical protein
MRKEFLPLLRPGPLQRHAWKLTVEIDEAGRPSIVCRNGDREFLFCHGSHQEKNVWLCWERKCTLTGERMIHAPELADAKTAAEAAQSELAALEPSYCVYLEDQLLTEAPNSR